MHTLLDFAEGQKYTVYYAFIYLVCSACWAARVNNTVDLFFLPRSSPVKGEFTPAVLHHPPVSLHLLSLVRIAVEEWKPVIVVLT